MTDFICIILMSKSDACIAQVLLNIYNKVMSSDLLNIKGKRFACLILAAGAGQRFGSSKQIADLNNKPLIRHIVDEANRVFQDSVFCMVGSNADAVKAVIADTCQIVENKDWQKGMGSTIAHGIRHLILHYNFDAVLVVLGDQYLLTKDDLIKYIDEYKSQSIIATNHLGKAGVPALFPKQYFDDLSKLKGEGGARLLLKANPHTIMLNVPNARYDIDTPEDLLAAAKSVQ